MALSFEMYQRVHYLEMQFQGKKCVGGMCTICSVSAEAILLLNAFSIYNQCRPYLFRLLI